MQNNAQYEILFKMTREERPLKKQPWKSLVIFKHRPFLSHSCY